MELVKVVLIFLIGIIYSANADPPGDSFATEIELIQGKQYVLISDVISIPKLCKEIFALPKQNIFAKPKDCLDRYRNKKQLANDLFDNYLEAIFDQQEHISSFKKLKFNKVIKDEHREIFSHLAWYIDQGTLEFKHQTYSTNKEEYFKSLSQLAKKLEIEDKIYEPSKPQVSTASFHGNYASPRWRNMQNDQFIQLYNMYSALRIEHNFQLRESTFFHSQNKNSYNSNFFEKGVIKIKEQDEVNHKYFIETRSHFLSPLEEYNELDRIFSGNMEEMAEHMAKEIDKWISHPGLLEGLTKHYLYNNPTVDILRDLTENEFIARHNPGLKYKLFNSLKNNITVDEFKKHLVEHKTNLKEKLKSLPFYEELSPHLEKTYQMVLDEPNFKASYLKRYSEAIEGIKAKDKVKIIDAGLLLREPETLKKFKLYEPLRNTLIENITDYKSLNMIWSELIQIEGEDQIGKNREIAEKIKNVLLSGSLSDKEKEAVKNISLRFYLNDFEIYQEFFTDFSFKTENSDHFFEFKESGFFIKPEAKKNLPFFLTEVIEEITAYQGDEAFILSTKQEWYLKYLLANFDEKVMLELFANQGTEDFAFNYLKEAGIKDPSKLGSILPSNRELLRFRLEISQRELYERILNDSDLKPQFIQQVIQEIINDPNKADLYFMKINGITKENEIFRQQLQTIFDQLASENKFIEINKLTKLFEDKLGRKLNFNDQNWKIQPFYKKLINAFKRCKITNPSD
ncbi:hypothetical protein N9N67_04190 [Bacteriovoracaceae bacterium]|nr:hypothetical protein [Bacteriovoracaceae bacterium]